tara:strand:- start:40 stop:282 length:243 start_codon:yes stop_codon:yes gene_type:complete
MSCQYKHPPAPIWTPQKHFGFCGPYCLCCRALSGCTQGACSVCIQDIKDKSIKINNDIQVKKNKTIFCDDKLINNTNKNK